MYQLKVREGLIAIIRPYLPVEKQSRALHLEDHLIDDLQINSAHMVDIILDIEDHFDVIMDDEAIGKLITLKDSIDLIMDQVSGPN